MTALSPLGLLDLLVRNAREHGLLAAGVNEPQQRQTDFPDEFDITSMPYKKSKVYPKRRDPSTLDLVVVHVTDVTGGFGVSKRQVQHWKNATIPARLVEQIDRADTRSGSAERRTSVARRIALWERYRNTPYHRIGAANGDNLRNHPLSFRTKHGNAGNSGAGWALDCGHDEDLDQWTLDTGRASLTSLIQEMHAASGKTVHVAPHRCFSAGRRNDTHRRVWLGVIKPVVEVLSFAEIDYEIAVAGGRPVPRSWDPEALYDDKGRRL